MCFPLITEKYYRKRKIYIFILIVLSLPPSLYNYTLLLKTYLLSTVTFNVTLLVNPKNNVNKKVDKAYIVMKKVPFDVIQKGKK